MARFLFVVPPMTGHTNPTLAVAAELSARGHEPAWCGYEALLERLLPLEARRFGLEGSLPDGFLQEIGARALTVRGLPGLKFLWEEVLLPLARDMTPGVERVVSEFRPDVIISDQQAFAGAFAARRAGLPWATSATTSADRRISLANIPKVLEWAEERLTELQVELGLEPVKEPENSPHRVIVFSTPALCGEMSHHDERYAFVGPSLTTRPDATPFPYEELLGVPRVFASLGTLNAERGQRFFKALSEGLGDDSDEPKLQVVCVAPDEFGPFPKNFLSRPSVPQLDLLPKMDAVICHGGHNTTTEALSNALPLVVCPIKDDQPVVAQQVADSGCGLRLSFTRPRPLHLREAVDRILHEPSFKEAATAISESFTAAGGPARAADHLEALIGVTT
jgi:MGT family glycosyltransferase